MSEETFKGYWHAGLATAIGVALGYNVMRCCAVPHRRNLLNIAVYMPLLVHEWQQARYHWGPK